MLLICSLRSLLYRWKQAKVLTVRKHPNHLTLSNCWLRVTACIRESDHMRSSKCDKFFDDYFIAEIKAQSNILVRVLDKILRAFSLWGFLPAARHRWETVSAQAAESRSGLLKHSVPFEMSPLVCNKILSAFAGVKYRPQCSEITAIHLRFCTVLLLVYIH